MSKKTQGIVVAVVLVAVGALGVTTGRYIASKRAMTTTHEATAVWEPGDTFPVLDLQTEWGDSVSTQTLLARGGVVLFIDLECPPCIAMAHKWNQAARDSMLDPAQIVAVTAQPASKIGPFRQHEGLDFNVYHDPAALFLANHWITSFPVAVIVNDASRVVSVSDNPVQPIDGGVLQSALVMVR